MSPKNENPAGYFDDLLSSIHAETKQLVAERLKEVMKDVISERLGSSFGDTRSDAHTPPSPHDRDGARPGTGDESIWPSKTTLASVAALGALGAAVYKSNGSRAGANGVETARREDSNPLVRGVQALKDTWNSWAQPTVDRITGARLGGLASARMEIGKGGSTFRATRGWSLHRHETVDVKTPGRGIVTVSQRGARASDEKIAAAVDIRQLVQNKLEAARKDVEVVLELAKHSAAKNRNAAKPFHEIVNNVVQSSGQDGEEINLHKDTRRILNNVSIKADSAEKFMEEFEKIGMASHANQTIKLADGYMRKSANGVTDRDREGFGSDKMTSLGRFHSNGRTAVKLPVASLDNREEAAHAYITALAANVRTPERDVSNKLEPRSRVRSAISR